MSRGRPDGRVDPSESDRSGYPTTTVRDPPRRNASDPSPRNTSDPFRERSTPVSLGCLGRSLLSISGICLLTATKFTDALTTGIGLTFVPGIYEANPVVDAVLGEFGVTFGLVVSSVAVVLGIAVLTELAAVWVSLRRQDGHLAPVVRLVGYGIPAVLFALVSVYNVRVLLAGIDAVGPI